MKAFLFVFDQSRFSKDDVIKRVDKLPAIENWYAFFGNTMCIAANLDSKSLSRLIREALPELKFIITEVDPESKGGWLPKSVWSFLNNPHSAQTESA